MRTSVELPKGQMLPSKDYRFGMGKNLQPQPPTSRAGGRMQCAVCVPGPSASLSSDSSTLSPPGLVAHEDMWLPRTGGQGWEDLVWGCAK